MEGSPRLCLYSMVRRTAIGTVNSVRLTAHRSTSKKFVRRCDDASWESICLGLPFCFCQCRRRLSRFRNRRRGSRLGCLLAARSAVWTKSLILLQVAVGGDIAANCRLFATIHLEHKLGLPDNFPINFGGAIAAGKANFVGS